MIRQSCPPRHLNKVIEDMLAFAGLSRLKFQSGQFAIDSVEISTSSASNAPAQRYPIISIARPIAG
jgi:hypothetical protein